jgi:hypothetical protein
MKKFRFIVFLVVITSLVLTACGRSPAEQATGLPGVDIKKALSDIRVYYNTETTLEKDVSFLRRQYEQTRSSFDLTIRDLLANNAICYKNVAETESTIGNAVMDSNASSDSLINALVTQSVSGEQATSICAGLNQQIATTVITNRQAILDAYNKFFEAALNYRLSLSNWPEIKVMNDLFQTYGDPRMVEQKLVEAGLPGFTDFAWMPTENLFMDYPGNKAKCDYYITGEFMNYLPASMKIKFSGHEESLLNLYQAQWMPQSGANGNCRLSRMAALDEMTVSILSTGTIDVINTNVDSGVIPTPAP